jgi:hypothetical protein
VPAGELEAFVLAELWGIAHDPAVRAAVRTELVARGFLPPDLDAALAHLDGVHERLSLADQRRHIRLVVQRVELDGAKGNATLRFHELGLTAGANP